MSPLHSQPYSQATFAAAAEANPELHPVQAAMRAMAGPRRPPLTVALVEERIAATVRLCGPEFEPIARQANARDMAVAIRLDAMRAELDASHVAEAA